MATAMTRSNNLDKEKLEKQREEREKEKGKEKEKVVRRKRNTSLFDTLRNRYHYR